MDVIALDRAGIAEVVAPNGTAVTEAQLERMWRLDPAPILCFDGDSAGQKAAIRAALRALPHLGARAHPALRRASRRPGPRRRRPQRRPRRRSRRCSPSPSRSTTACGGTSCEAAAAHHPRSPRRPPPAPDRARAGHRRPGARRLYRDDWLDRFEARSSARSAVPPRQPRPAPRMAAARRPLRAARAARRRRTRAAIGAGGIDRADRPRPDPRLRQFPRGAAATIASSSPPCRSPTRAPRRIRDELVNAAFSGATLDRESTCHHIARQLERRRTWSSAPHRRQWAFPSPAATRDPERAVRDLGAAIERSSARRGDRRGPRRLRPSG